ncbi:MAG: phosphoribosylformylglycinamidine cyclo-ligase [Acidobacteria bacterium]|nr:MAG: phosphoribosylformylglycinamidine cyclo-ligase [Acidobacteriota bacterium]
MKERSDAITYRDAGVDIDAAERAMERIRQLARRTFTDRVLTDIGSFGALFRADFAEMREPILVASVDGIGTKLKVAFMTGIHHTVGYDLVSHCVNDILVQGARPLFFMDYIALGKMDPATVAEIVDGLARGCREAGCALIGGETAEMPGFYAPGEYDVAGFIVGIVDRAHLIDGRTIAPGDVLLGLKSLGLHTNGFSLARKLLFETAGYGVDTHVEELGCTVGEELLKPHRNYLTVVSGLLESGKIKGLVHITGGGFEGNIPRILPAGCAVEIELGSWPVPPIFELLQRLGRLERREMFRTFNMGIGMILIVAREEMPAVKQHFATQGEETYTIGRVVERGASTVTFISP